MTYSIEHLVIAFIVGLVIGVVSTVILDHKGSTLEIIVSLLVMSIWLTLHTYGFFFNIDVPWVFDFAGFGAAGNFIGVSVSDLTNKASEVVKKVKK